MSTERNFTYRVTVAVKPELWALEYGEEVLEDLRKDVRSSVQIAVEQTGVASEGAIRVVRVL